MYGSEEERPRISDFQMDNRRYLLGIRRIDLLPNTRIREFVG